MLSIWYNIHEVLQNITTKDVKNSLGKLVRTLRDHERMTEEPLGDKRRIVPINDSKPRSRVKPRDRYLIKSAAVLRSVAGL